MDIMKNYADLLTEIDVIKEQIKLTEEELDYWFGRRIPLGSAGVHRHGAETALIQTQKKIAALKKLNARLKDYEQSANRQTELINRFCGLEYRIAYKRYVENKTLKEIAKELGYSHQYVKEISSKSKTTYF